jgi:uncharacterized protein
MMKRVELKTAGRTILSKCYVATSFFSRLLGLMGRKELPADEAILFPRCNSIHTFFMRFPIDVVFVSKDGEIIEVKESLPPWRMLVPRVEAAYVIEMKASSSRTLGITKGLRLDHEDWI